MCLAKVSDKYSSPESLIQSGWKEFSTNGTQIEFQVMAYKGSGRVPLDKWIEAEGKTIENYQAGFHVYEDEMQLNPNRAKRRVYFRYMHTRGTQDGMTVVVAKEIYVPANPDDWPPQK